MKVQKKKARPSLTRVAVILNCGVAVAISLVAFYVLNQNVKNIVAQTEGFAGQQAATTAQQLGEVFSGYKQMCDILVSSQALADYAALTQADAEDSFVNSAAELRRELVSLATVYGEHLNTIAVYFPGSDSAVTAARRVEPALVDGFFDAYPGIGRNTLDTQAPVGGWAIHYGDTDTNRGWLMRPARSAGAEVYILVDFDMNSLVSRYISPEMQVLVGNGGQGYYANGVLPGEEEYRALLESATQAGQYVQDGTTYKAAHSTVRELGTYVLVGVSMQRVAKTVGMLRVVIVTAIVLIIQSVIMLLLYLNSKVFSPIQYLRTKTNGAADTSALLHTIADDMVSLQAEKQQMLDELGGIRPLALGKLLVRLHEEPAGGRGTALARSCLLMAGVQQGQGYMLFAVSCIKDRAGFFTTSVEGSGASMQLGMLYFVLDNVLQDMLFEKYPGTLAPISGELYLVTVACNEPSAAGEINGIVQKMVGFFDNAFETTLAGTTPLWGKEEADYTASVAAAFKEASHLEFWHTNKKRDAMRRERVSFSHYCRQIKKLINRVNAQDYEGGIDMLEHVLDSAIPSGVDSTHIAKYRVYAMATILVTIIDEQIGTDGEFMEALHFEERLYNANNIMDIKDEINRLLTESLHRHQAREGTATTVERMESVKTYIQGHYTENGLNVNQLAAHFGMSAPYLSRSFKQYMGINILEYIQHLRVDAAKKLLQSDSVKAIAQRVGFWDTQGLVRAFKKYEGVSPSEYKKLLEQENSLG